MTLTRKLLKSMGLAAAQVDEIIAAHVDSVDAVKASAAAESTALAQELATAKSAAAAELSALQSRFDAFRAQTLRAQKAALLTDALVAAGANPAAAPLMAGSVDLDALEMADGALTRTDETVSDLRARWSDLFARESVQPLPALDPHHAAPAVLTRRDVEAMSMEDINRHWSAVSTALREHM